LRTALTTIPVEHLNTPFWRGKGAFQRISLFCRSSNSLWGSPTTSECVAVCDTVSSNCATASERGKRISAASDAERDCRMSSSPSGNRWDYDLISSSIGSYYLCERNIRVVSYTY
jgi:hypothetical protein